MNHDLIYLKHILQSIVKIQKFVTYKNKKSIDQDLVESGIIRELQTMSESTQKLSKSLKLSAQDIPWRDIGDFRNKLVHEYLGINTEIIWSVIKKELPKLKKRVTKMIKFLEEKEKTN
jgi:uncharacterized protein with HEPN domain